MIRVDGCLQSLRLVRIGFSSYPWIMPEPPHVHVQRERMVAKFWLDPLALERAGGFRSHELTTIGKLVQEHQ